MWYINEIRTSWLLVHQCFFFILYVGPLPRRHSAVSSKHRVFTQWQPSLVPYDPRENTDIYYSLDSAESRVQNNNHDDHDQGWTRNIILIRISSRLRRYSESQTSFSFQENIYCRPNAREAERNYIHTIVSTNGYKTTKEWQMKNAMSELNGRVCAQSATIRDQVG